MYVATLIAESELDRRVFDELAHHFSVDAVGLTLTGQAIVAKDAGDYFFEAGTALDAGLQTQLAERLGRQAASIARPVNGGDMAFDCVVQPVDGREKRLLVADMDSTMITVECLDELADYAGIKPAIAAITERAMRGELDFAAALDARVALLEGLGEAAIDRCLAERVRIMPGAVELVRTMRAGGAYTVLVSGGFTRFAEPVAEMIGFDRVVANRLEIADGRLTGRVAKPIVDADTKVQTLLVERERLGLSAAATLAVGDGANDLGMIGLAGLGVAYHAKPIVAAAAGARIDNGDLAALLHAQGIAQAEWVRG